MMLPAKKWHPSPQYLLRASAGVAKKSREGIGHRPWF
jgi:hypothetical protein